VFFEGIDPHDIRAGELNDGYFLSALQILSENPALVKRLFIQDTFNEKGFYKIRLCKDGQWQVVTIDDYFPCYVNGGPIFTFGEGNELWVMLLEKAYAKTFGTYQNLIGGSCHEALEDLTGCPTEHIIFPSFKDDFEQKDEEYWDTIQAWFSKGYLIYGNTELDPAWDQGGSEASHFYSIINLVESEGIKLLKIRNAWGVFTWDGAWSNGHENWEENPTVKSLCKYTGEEDGTFWISFDDYYNLFNSIHVNKVEEWNEIRLPGKFI